MESRLGKSEKLLTTYKTEFTSTIEKHNKDVDSIVSKSVKQALDSGKADTDANTAKKLAD